MNGQVDWADRIDAAVDAAPSGFDPHAVLALGHRRLRRRRQVAALGVAAVVGVAGTAWGLAPNSRPTHDQSTVATMPPTLLGPTSAPAGQSLVRFELNTGKLIVQPGVTVERRMRDVMVSGLDSDSIAAVVTFEGQTWWTIARVIPGRVNWADQHLAVDGRTFEQWVREKSVLGGGAANGASSGWVSIDEAGEVRTDPGVVLVDSTTPARADQAPAGVTSAAGTIEVEGARLCFVVRQDGDRADDFYVAESEYQGCGAAVPGISDAAGTGRSQ